MKQPVWIVTSCLAIMLLAAVLFILLSRAATPRWHDIEPDEELEEVVEEVTRPDIEKIYTRDLFRTESRDVARTPQQRSLVKPIPPPPPARPFQPPKKQAPSFLPPMNITLKGIMVTDNDRQNRAIIADNQTKKERVYKIGDRLGDAQVIKIMKNRVILIRSNGQQETLYLRVKDAQGGPVVRADAQARSATVVKKVTDSTYLVDPMLFVKQIPDIAQFINTFDLTSVYQKGQSVGCRVGRIGAGSLALELGFLPNDVIVTVNGIPATTTENRYKIYEAVLNAHLGDTITVETSRGRLLYTLAALQEPEVVTIGSVSKEKAVQQPQQQPRMVREQLEKDKVRLMRERSKMAPTLERIRRREKESILKKITRDAEQRKRQERPPRFDI